MEPHYLKKKTSTLVILVLCKYVNLHMIDFENPKAIFMAFQHLCCFVAIVTVS